MGKTLYGKKLGMTRYFLDEGGSTPATIIKAGPCVVIQIKTAGKDGYEAIQVGFELQKENRLNKPIRGHFRAAGDRVFRHLREIRVDDAGENFQTVNQARSRAAEVRGPADGKNPPVSDGAQLTPLSFLGEKTNLA